jgi:hypothetical protein
MTIQESKASIFIIKPDGNTALISTRATKTSFDFGCPDVINPGLMFISGKENYETTYHGLFG